ncbi:MAG TPA: chromate transporter [Bryobacteraceae bacterium]|nr:chromate transporter [Bryobacteraceae bacterium]
MLSLLRLSSIYTRASNLTFGGGDPTMAALQNELVARGGWLTPEQYGLVYALARITPGTNMLAFCAGSAWVLKGWPGALLAVLGASVPAALAVVLLTVGYQAFRHNPHAMSAIAGTLAAAVGMMAVSAWQLARPQMRRGKPAVRAVVLVAGAAMAGFGPRVSPIVLLGLAAAIGLFWRAPEKA